ncbi:anti-sigma factor family protein [Hyalangium rubrum]|uniref:Zf-HC2 domain-containing protein n=1 Tax=Hyalangium rubrum TaxID=3103134 RepID=A0ABU5HI82_9BACT|nr:zf-HC2 domain-containing protein [Hyalangium sp. s54d21]MDY7231790.1 zf-HC2 domain-containing protein [Hyalangium sp. s54d21]
MSCTFEEDLTAYIDGELPAARREELQVHLGTCAECQRTEALLRTTVARMAELPEPVLSTNTRRAVLAKVDALPPPLKERLLALLRPPVLVPSLGLAAALALVVYASRDTQGVDVPDAGTLELAANMELMEDYDVVGLDSFEDLEVVENLHELEVQ